MIKMASPTFPMIQAANRVRTEENKIDKLISDRIINQDVSDDITESGSAREFTCVNMNEFITQVTRSDRASIFEQKYLTKQGVPLSTDNSTERDQGTRTHQQPKIIEMKKNNKV